MRGTKIDRAGENARFLKALRRTANVTMAAAEAGQTRKTFQKRRARNPDFAAEWDAALAYAQAQLAAGRAGAPGGDDPAVTKGGEYSVRGSRGRRIQVRRSPKGALTAAGERRFLAHLAATANVRLSAQAAGIGVNAIYARRRRSAEFAREMTAALGEGYDRLELALLANAIASLGPDGSEPGAWRDEADGQPEPLVRMTPKDALLLLGYRRPNIVDGRPHDGFPVQRATREEAEGWLTRALDRLDRRKARDGG
jgi:hypothetical protein